MNNKAIAENEMVGRPKKMSDHDFLELYRDGLMDVEIAEIMGVASSTVNNRRRKLGLPKNKQYCRTAKRLRVYDGESEEYIAEGTVREIAEKLHTAESTVYHYIFCGKYGAPCRYKVIEVEKWSLA